MLSTWQGLESRVTHLSMCVKNYLDLVNWNRKTHFNYERYYLIDWSPGLNKKEKLRWIYQESSVYWDDPVNCRQSHSWADGVGFYKKPGWAMRSKPVKYCSMASESVLVSRFFPCLSSCADIFQWSTVKLKYNQHKSFPPQLAFGQGVSSSHITATVCISLTSCLKVLLPWLSYLGTAR